MRPFLSLVAALVAASVAPAAIITYNAAPYTGDPATAQVMFDDGAQPGKVVVTISLTNGTIADIRGLFLNVANPALLSGLSAVGMDVTATQFGPADSVNNLSGVNSNPATRFDLGVVFGTAGIGQDDINPTTTFVLSHSSASLTNADFDTPNSQGFIFALRMTSVQLAGGGRNGSSKLSQDGDGNGGGDGNGDGDPDPDVVPEPATLVTVAVLGGMGLIGYRLRRKKA
jgi:hypothetical protein